MVVLLFAVAVFQPTLPARGATELHNGNADEMQISTHAPRTGSDSAKQQFCRPESETLHKKYTIKQSF